MWDFKLLNTFITIVDCGGFTPASERLNLTQSTVSHQIKRLENQIGDRLFKRNRAMCQLTHAGERLYQDVAPMVRQSAQLWQDYRQEDLYGSVRVGAADDCFNTGLAEALRNFSTRHPHVHLDFEIGLTREIQARLHNKEFDLALVRCRQDESIGTPLIIEPYLWCVPRDFHYQTGETLPLVVGPSPCLYRETVCRELDKANIPYQITVTCASQVGIKTAVDAGMAVSALPLSAYDPNQPPPKHPRHLPKLPHSKLAIALSNKADAGPARALHDVLLSGQAPLATL